MEIQVEVSDDGGQHREYVGIEVCRGPGVMRVLLTRPYRMAGQTVSLPLDRIESIVEIESGMLGEPVRAVDGAARWGDEERDDGPRDGQHQGSEHG